MPFLKQSGSEVWTWHSVLFNLFGTDDGHGICAGYWVH